MGVRSRPLCALGVQANDVLEIREQRNIQIFFSLLKKSSHKQKI